MHHDDGACWLRCLGFALFQHALPVSLLYAALHPQLVMEVIVLIPEMPDAVDHTYQQNRLNHEAQHGFLLSALITVYDGERQEAGTQQVIGDIEKGIILFDREDG